MLFEKKKKKVLFPNVSLRAYTGLRNVLYFSLENDRLLSACAAASVKPFDKMKFLAVQYNYYYSHTG